MSELNRQPNPCFVEPLVFTPKDTRKIIELYQAHINDFGDFHPNLMPHLSARSW